MNTPQSILGLNYEAESLKVLNLIVTFEISCHKKRIKLSTSGAVTIDSSQRFSMLILNANSEVTILSSAFSNL